MRLKYRRCAMNNLAGYDRWLEEPFQKEMDARVDNEEEVELDGLEEDIADDDWRQGAPRTCAGYGIECDNEPEPDEELCTRCQDGKDLEDRNGEPDADLM